MIERSKHSDIAPCSISEHDLPAEFDTRPLEQLKDVCSLWGADCGASTDLCRVLLS